MIHKRTKPNALHNTSYIDFHAGDHGQVISNIS
jgi:hypothetical protein